jgi:preprotein translocase subunit SecE
MAKVKNRGARRGGAGAGQGGSGQGATAAAATTIEVDSPAPKKPRVSPGQFLSQVRAEGRKITWPSYKETWITSVMVLIMVTLAAIFFWVVDFGLGALFQRVISIGQ